MIEDPIWKLIAREYKRLGFAEAAGNLKDIKKAWGRDPDRLLQILKGSERTAPFKVRRI